ncbi:MAG: accessory gene regulator B family protein [Clostridiales bacterium]|nr:accessory gene regulator B family protein [Clostridiales bacterium]
MGAQLQVDRDKIDVFAYGLVIVLGTLVQLTLLIWLSLMMDVFITTMICLMAFASLRYFGDGIHFSIYYGCLTVGIAFS